MKEMWRRWFGTWWWLVFQDGLKIGPMNWRKALRWSSDAPEPHHIEWIR